MVLKVILYLEKKQYEMIDNKLGQIIIKNKVSNQLKVLKKIRNKSSEDKRAIEMLSNALNNLDNYNLDFYQVMSIEGLCAKTYFKILYGVYDWAGRKPRTKIDPINSALDIGYTILFNYIEAILCLYDFDLYVGVFHKEFYKRKSLVCDLMEPFRVIIDQAVLKSFNLKQFDCEDFDIYQNRYILKKDANSKYIKVFFEAIMYEREAIFLYIQNYYKKFMKANYIKIK